MSHNTHSTVGQIAEQGVVRCPLFIVRRSRHSLPRTTDHGPRTFRPQPPAPSPPPHGISLTEVLIAMGILTVGLLGVASIFPVASFYMQKGDVADRGSAIAQAAFNEAITKGYLDPANWWMMTPTEFEQFQMNADGKIGTLSIPQSFSRPLLRTSQECKVSWPTSVYCRRMGSVYVIDPTGAASLSEYGTGNHSERVARSLPASAELVNAYLNNYYAGPQWQTFFLHESAQRPAIWPIRRVTFRQNRFGPPAATDYYRTTTPLTRMTAEEQFTSGDDLALDVPASADQPSQQLMSAFTIGSVNVPLARQSRGDFSWIISVAPEDPLNLAGGRAEVSVVVFHKRPLASAPPVDDDDDTEVSTNERMTTASIVSTGLSGGEVHIAPINDGISEDISKVLKKGQWVMLCGPHPNSSDNKPLFVARWYRVLSIEDDDTGKLIALRGPQWPWQPQTGASALSNNLCVGIFPGAVAVHSKTVRLEGNSSWSVQ